MYVGIGRCFRFTSHFTADAIAITIAMPIASPVLNPNRGFLSLSCVAICSSAVFSVATWSAITESLLEIVAV